MRLRYTTLLALLAVAAPLPARLHAQRQGALRPSTTGVIRDFSTGVPLAGALVEFPALRRKATTDAEGRFTLSNVPPGRHKMVVSQLGFRTLVREQDITDGSFLYVPLEPDPLMIKSVEVQVDRLANRRRSVDVSVIAFERRMLLGSASLNVAEFIRTQLHGTVCPNRRALCVQRRGQAIQPIVYIDERRAFGLEELFAYPPHDVYLIEAYDSGRMIRVYTNWFVQKLARNNTTLQQIVIW
jgi:hypothetical protein